MTTIEAKERITNEFIEKFNEWLRDYADMPNAEYGRKYGWQKNQNRKVKDNISGITFFQRYIFSGRWLPEWEREGYDRNTIWELHKEGFLSLAEYSNWNARATGRTNFYYIRQEIAKKIWKEYHSTERV